MEASQSSYTNEENSKFLFYAGIKEHEETFRKMFKRCNFFVFIHDHFSLYRVTQKKRELLKTPTKIEEIQEKKLLTEIEPLQLAF